MIKGTNSKKYFYVLIVLIVLIAAIFLLFILISKSIIPSKNAGPNDNIWNSLERLGANFSVPTGYQITEGMNAIFLKNGIGEIRITKQGTNYSNLSDYLNGLGITVNDSQTTEVNGFTAVSGTVGNQKYYFILTNNWIYSLSTSFPELYDDLDQIARSFRYVP